MGSEEFNPQSHDSMFAKILSEMESDRRARAEFREEVRASFKKGSERMDALDGRLAEVHTETRKTNGRVTKLENRYNLQLAKLAGAATILGALLWAFEKGLIHLGAG
jgi:predicted nuclease with TOPRIM domain